MRAGGHFYGGKVPDHPFQPAAVISFMALVGLVLPMQPDRAHGPKHFALVKRLRQPVPSAKVESSAHSLTAETAATAEGAMEPGCVASLV